MVGVADPSCANVDASGSLVVHDHATSVASMVNKTVDAKGFAIVFPIAEVLGCPQSLVFSRPMILHRFMICLPDRLIMYNTLTRSRIRENHSRGLTMNIASSFLTDRKVATLVLSIGVVAIAFILLDASATTEVEAAAEAAASAKECTDRHNSTEGATALREDASPIAFLDGEAGSTEIQPAQTGCRDRQVGWRTVTAHLCTSYSHHRDSSGRRICTYWKLVYYSRTPIYERVCPPAIVTWLPPRGAADRSSLRQLA